MKLTHETSWNGTHADPLIEANQQLVLAMLRVQSDLSVAVKALHEVSRTAERDTLTELPNRALFLSRLSQAMTHANRSGKHMALLFLDLDHFKQINDQHGHTVGDSVLKRTARCLVSAIRKADTVSRHGGDEFLILLTDITLASDAALAAEKIIAGLDDVSHRDDGLPCLTASIGIYPEDGTDADTLIHRADMAMYRAKKRTSGGYVFHDRSGSFEAPAAMRDGASPSTRPARNHWEYAEQEARHALLELTNQRMVLAAASAEKLRCATESAQRRQVEFLATLKQQLRQSLASIRDAATLLNQTDQDPAALPLVKAKLDLQVQHACQLLDGLLDL